MLYEYRVVYYYFGHCPVQSLVLSSVAHDESDEWTYTDVIELYEQNGRLVIKTISYNHIYEKLVTYNNYINEEFIIAYTVVEKRG